MNIQKQGKYIQYYYVLCLKCNLSIINGGINDIELRLVFDKEEKTYKVEDGLVFLHFRRKPDIIIIYNWQYKNSFLENKIYIDPRKPQIDYKDKKYNFIIV